MSYQNIRENPRLEAVIEMLPILTPKGAYPDLLHPSSSCLPAERDCRKTPRTGISSAVIAQRDCRKSPDLPKIVQIRGSKHKLRSEIADRRLFCAVVFSSLSILRVFRQSQRPRSPSPVERSGTGVVVARCSAVSFLMNHFPFNDRVFSVSSALRKSSCPILNLLRSTLDSAFLMRSNAEALRRRQL